MTSWFVHVGFQHVLSNSLLFAMVAYQLEEKYGCWRITLLWALSALGGTLAPRSTSLCERADVYYKGPASCFGTVVRGSF